MTKKKHNYVWTTRCPICKYECKWYSLNYEDKNVVQASCSPCGHQGIPIISESRNGVEVKMETGFKYNQ